jgi:hypothetical protein
VFGQGLVEAMEEHPAVRAEPWSQEFSVDTGVEIGYISRDD